MTLVLLAANATSADKQGQAANGPVANKTVSAPPAATPQPTEVKITSLPALPPAEVKIVSVPPDESTVSLVWATWGLLFATLILVAATFIVGWMQSRENRKRDKAARDLAMERDNLAMERDRSGMMREVNRSAHNVGATAKRISQIALRIPPARTELGILSGQGGMTPSVRTVIETELKIRTERLDRIEKDAAAVAMSDLQRTSAQELTAYLFRLDAREVEMDAMRDAITEELNRYESESREIRERNVTMQAAARGTQPPQHQ